uniref:Uncharacterized protein LOC104224909 n=1 Tax=Nicotiana sylvestris TaxID=4096 RepID=A0A1U7WL08_NICSY
MACLNPIDLFANYDKDRIMKLAEYYPNEFDDNKLRDLSFQLDSFIVYARMPHSKFINLKGMKDLAIVMAETKLDQTWCHIYLLVKLTLILPVATASVERAFSSMKLIKSDLRNSISEEFLNGCLVCNIERKVFATVSNDAIIDLFQTIDLQLHELNSRFDVVTSDLLLGMACLNPIDSFANYDKDRIMKLAEYYPNEFDDNKLRDLSFQLDSFIVYARMPHSKFINLKGMKDLAIVMAETKLDQTWCHIYLLVKLTLILLVATASVERAFSSMKLIKSDLRNSISEEFLNGCLVCNIKRKVFAT